MVDNGLGNLKKPILIFFKKYLLNKKDKKRIILFESFFKKII